MQWKYMRSLFVGLAVLFAAQLVAIAADVPPLTAAGCEEFGFNFYRKLSATEPYRFSGDANVAISPYSLASVLQALRLGASGEVEQELNSALTYSGTGQGSEAGVLKPGDLKNKAIQFSVGNSLWVDKRFAVKPSFVKATKDQLGAAVFSADFRNPEKEASRINGWISDHTAGHIKDLVTPKSVNGASMTIANAVYFKAEWEKPFNAADTQEEPFYLVPARPVQVSMMNEVAEFRYAEKDGVQVLELPYAGGEVSMVLLLPLFGEKHWAALESSLTGSWFRQAMGALEKRSVTIKLPRWKITFEPNNSIAVLKSMGIEAMFKPTWGLMGISDQDQPYVSDFMHRTWMEVNEKGTEAAAATVVVVVPGCAMQPEKPATFFANHPFFFVIRHNATGTPLFVGRVSNPAEK